MEAVGGEADHLRAKLRAFFSYQRLQEVL